VDVDRLDGVVRGWNARLPVQIGAATAWLEPRSLDELHPDHLLVGVPELSAVLELRAALGSDRSAAARLEVLLGASASAAPAPGSAPAAGVAAGSGPGNTSAAGAESGLDTLARLLGSPSAAQAVAASAGGSAPAAARAGLGVDRLIRSIVAQAAPAPVEPHVSEIALASLADAELGRRLRSLLRAPAWRALEGTWRGIDGLCRNCPDEALVRTSVLDASFDELAADLAGLARVLASESPDVLLVDHLFGADAAELGVLARLLEVCQASGVQLVAGARPELAGCAHFVEVERPDENEHVLSEDVRAAWAEVSALRERGAALGLALPRFVLRQPYGAAGEPLERLRFEELVDPSDHEAFAWGNGAYLLARALCIQHADAAGARPGGAVDVRELPIVHLETGGEIAIKPPAESWLSDRAVGKLLTAGFAVLQAVRGTDRVVVHPAT
jgi:type VI secretion system protein ImpC